MRPGRGFAATDPDATAHATPCWRDPLVGDDIGGHADVLKGAAQLATFRGLSGEEQPEMVTEPIERIDDCDRGERLHPLRRRSRDGARDHGNTGSCQGGRHDDGKVRVRKPRRCQLFHYGTRRGRFETYGPVSTIPPSRV